MNHNLRFITVLLLSIICSFTVYAQDKTVTGKVISGTDQMPLPGVSVLVKGTSSGTVTNIDGEYTLTVPEASEVLVFSYIGFKSVEMEIGDQSAIDLTMEEDVGCK